MNPPAHEQTRARYPDTSGYVERDGVKIYYEVYGSGEPTVLLLPTWSIIHSDTGRCRSPTWHDTAACSRSTGAATAAPTGRRIQPPTTSTSSLPTRSPSWMRRAPDTAVLVSLSLGCQRALILAADHPERVDGAVFIGPAFPGAGGPLTERLRHSWDDGTRYR